jgi:hypothetical protein
MGFNSINFFSIDLSLPLKIYFRAPIFQYVHSSNLTFSKKPTIHLKKYKI